MEPGQVINDKYQIQKRVGRGAYSICYLSTVLNEDGKVEEDSKQVVLKISNKPEFSFLKDYTISSELGEFPHFLRYDEFGQHKVQNFSTNEEKSFDYLVSEFMVNGTLFDYVTNDGFDETCARQLFKQTLLAIETMHTNGYVHLDIKLGNILLDSNFTPKLCDLGFSQRASEDHVFECKDFKIQGTKNYVCPEIYEEENFSGFQADLFALAVSFFVLLVGDYPFGSAKKTDTKYQNIYKKNPFVFWRKHSKAKKKIKKGLISDNFVDLITRMIVPNREDRITVDEIKEHEWYQDSTMDSSMIKEYMENIKAKKASK